MLVTMDPSSGPQSRAPSIMNSPTLARVERARIRLEAQALNNNENHSLERRILDPKVSQRQMCTFRFIFIPYFQSHFFLFSDFDIFVVVVVW